MTYQNKVKLVCTSELYIHFVFIHNTPYFCLSLFDVHSSVKLVNLTCEIFCRYRQILDKAIQFTDADQLESLKAFVEASMMSPSSFYTTRFVH